MSDVFNPLVSIIIPVYNGSNYVKEAIDSALAQTYKNIEVIVVNDGSTDNTEKIVKSYGDKIRYFYKENGGVASALNLAIENSKGEYISWLSHDDVYYPNKIQKQIETLSKLEDKNTFIYSNSEYINEKGRLLYSTNYEYKEASVLLNNPKYAALYGLISGCTLLMPKNAVIKYNCFDSELKYTQDYDLWYRMLPEYKLLFVPEVLVKTRIHNKQDFQKACIRQQQEITKLWKAILNSISENDRKEFGFSDYGLHKYLLDNFFYPLNKSPNHKEMIAYLENYISNHKGCIDDIENIKVSIIMPFFNRPEYTSEAIESIIKQTHQNWEIILVNDLSTEDISILDKYKSNKKIIFVNNKYEKGVSGARNTGLELATGEYVAFLDSDDLFFPTKIEKQLKFMLLNGADFCATSYQQFFSNGKINAKNLNAKDTYITKIYTIAPSMVMMSKKIYKNHRFLNNMSLGEDVCYWADVSRKYHLFIYDEILTNFRVTENTTCKTPEKLYKGALNIFTHLYRDLNLNVNLHIYNSLLDDIQNKRIIIKNRKKRISCADNKYWRIFYRMMLRPILKIQFGKKILKEKYDVRYL